MNRIQIFTGHFGSGKTELSINYVLQVKDTEEKPPLLIDLDLINPYFRSRDHREALLKRGVEVIAPQGELQQVDLPIITPDIFKALQDRKYRVIIDVGGDPDGATSLGMFYSYFQREAYTMYMVVNPYRPQSREIGDVLELKEAIERVSRLTITGLIANGNLGSQTTQEVVEEGYARVEEMAEEMGVPVKMVGVREDLMGTVQLPGKDILPVQRYLNLLW